MMKDGDRLSCELQRLFGLPPSRAGSAGDESGRRLGLRLHRSADWPALASLLAGLGEELQLPLPALSVEAEGGYRLWFSLAEPVAASAGLAFLAGLQQRYLGALPAGRVSVDVPPGGERLPEMPAYDAAGERWTAFIDPGLGGMFSDESGLDLPPSRDRQADLLVAVKSWRQVDFARACNELAALVGAASGVAAPVSPRPSAATGWQQVAGDYREPFSFLLAVMNDPGATPEHRLRAAEALLPYCAPAKPEGEAD